MSREEAVLLAQAETDLLHQDSRNSERITILLNRRFTGRAWDSIQSNRSLQ